MNQVVTRLLLISALAASAAFSQVTTGTILGSVTDSTGAAVSAATITITEVNKNTTIRAQSDAGMPILPR